MSGYLDLPDDHLIRLASEAVAIGTAIPPVIEQWLQHNGLLYKIQNPQVYICDQEQQT